MAPPNEETMQKGHEASVGCFQGKTVIYGPHGPRCVTRYTLDTKHANNGYKKANTDSGSEGAVYEKSAVSGEYCGRPIPKENHYIWSPFSPNFLTEMNSHSRPFHGSLHAANHGRIFPANWFPHVPSQMLPHGYPIKNAFQEFQYFVVIDFEATCDKEKNPHPQEIIEFPSVLVNGVTGQLEGCFQKYVRPSHNKRLTEFCKELTGIHQSQVDGGVSLSEALLMHDKWLEEKGIKQTNFAIVTWSNWDCRVMLESECRFKRIRKPPYFNRWINLKVPFCEVFGGARCNLKEAVEMAGLTWEGRAHCGLDDAKNTARLLTHLMQRGFKFSITNSLLWQSADNPYIMHQQIPGPPEHRLGLSYQAHKWKKPAYMTVIPIQPAQLSRPLKEPLVRCFCGATSIKFCKHGSFFFGCGNWTATRGALCPFSKWVPPACDGAEAV